MNGDRQSTTVHVLADDLTGALDAAAEFVGLAGPILVSWTAQSPLQSAKSFALDTGTRELSEVDAAAIVSRAAPSLAGGSIAFKKVDSLLRGNTIAELDACLRTGIWRHCVFAPAFPHQGRITRGGRQDKKDGAEWTAISGDLVEQVAARGQAVRLGCAGAELAVGVTVFDAATQADLETIVARAQQASGQVLWCGSGGLARALAHGSAPCASAALPTPVLGLFGSDQAVTIAQLAACREFWVRLADGSGSSAALLDARLVRTGVALASFDLPLGFDRMRAAERIRGNLNLLTRYLRAPRTLIVAGGETLRAVCESVGAEALEVHGQVEPGIPRSVLKGGRWDGVELVSKSGAFGYPTLWRDLFELNGFYRLGMQS